MANPQPQKKSGKRPAPGGVSSVSDFKSRKGIELLLPSGFTCLVKRPGMDKLLKSGVMPDTLTPIAMQHIKAAESGGRGSGEDDISDEILEQLMQDPDQMGEMFLSFDRATAMCVIEPKCRLHIYTTQDAAYHRIPEGFEVGDEIEEGDRDEDILYTDDVDIDDKMFIFQFVVGGTSDLEQFRSQQAATVAGARTGEDVPGSPE